MHKKMNCFILSSFFLFIFLTSLKAEFTKLQWKDLGSKEVEYINIDVNPMPIINPGQVVLNIQANFKRRFQGNLKTTLNIIRTISGLTIPIRW